MQQKELLKLCEQHKIPQPLPKPKPLGVDRRGRPLEDYTIEEYAAWELDQEKLVIIKQESRIFRERFLRERLNRRPKLKQRASRKEGEVDESIVTQRKSDLVEDSPVTREELFNEQKRRVMMAQVELGKNPGRYECDPEWDDVVPIPQDDGEQPLAAIAYSDEYAEGTSTAVNLYDHGLTHT